MAADLAKSQDFDRFLPPLESSVSGSGFGEEALNEQSMLPPGNESLPFSPVENSIHQSLVPSSVNPTESSSISPHPSSFNVAFSTISTDAVDGSSNAVLIREGPEESEQVPSMPVSLFNDNLCNSSSLVGSSSGWSSDESRPSSVDMQEFKYLSAGAGLANLGNTCFLNAILQCFTHTAPFVVGIRSANHAIPCDGGDEEFCVLCAIRDHIELSLSSLGGIISPVKLVDNLSYFSSYFQRYQQEDAHEFMQSFLDKLERCLESDAKDKISSENESLVMELFGGRLMSKLCCCNCGHCSQTYEPLVDLSLEIENVDSLSSALVSFTRVEKIEDPETKFKCENCKKEVLVEKQLKLEKIPLVVTFHLKRFKTDGSFVEKIDKHVEFPLELDLQAYTMGAQDTQEEFEYELHAIVVHTGFSSSSGHYFSFVRSSPDTWHRMDDSKVTRVSEAYVLSQEAYILLYKRKGTPWFSSLIELQDLCLNLEASNSPPKLVLDNIDCPAESIIHCEATIVPSEIVENELENISSANLQTLENVSIIKVEYNDVFHSLTPPGSPSPDINIFQSPEPQYRIPSDHLKTPEPQYRIPTDHLKTENCTTSGRPLSKSVDDPERKAALRYIKKSMPSSRGSRMIAALLGSQSDGVLNKKKRMRSSPCKTTSPRNNRRKSGHNLVPYVAAEN